MLNRTISVVWCTYLEHFKTHSAVADLGEGRRPLFWVKKKKRTDGKRAGRAS